VHRTDDSDGQAVAVAFSEAPEVLFAAPVIIRIMAVVIR
jgi:hypothetical protein